MCHADVQAAIPKIEDGGCGNLVGVATSRGIYYMVQYRYGSTVMGWGIKYLLLEFCGTYNSVALSHVSDGALARAISERPGGLRESFWSISL